MTAEERFIELESKARSHDVAIDLLISIGERQHTLLEEIRQDCAMTRRLWVHLARKNGWLEDADWPPPP